jgi:hypothetical protein
LVDIVGDRVVVESEDLVAFYRQTVREATGPQTLLAFEELIPDITAYF